MKLTSRLLILGFFAASVLLSNADVTSGAVTGTAGHPAALYYGNPNAGDSLVSFDWASNGDLYYATGDANWGLNFNVYKYDGSAVSNVYSAPAFAGSRITKIGGQMYFNDGGDFSRSTFNYYRYEPALGGASVKVMDSTTPNGNDCWDLARRNGAAELWVSGTVNGIIRYSKLDAEGNLSSQPMINLGTIGGASGPIAFDASGNLYCADGYGSNNIYRFTAAEVAAAMNDPTASPLTPGGHVWATIGVSNDGGATGMFVQEGVGLVVTATSWASSSSLLRYPISVDGTSGAYEVLATSPARITETRFHNGTIYAADASGIYSVAVPEPATLWLVVTFGLAACIYVCRKSSRNKARIATIALALAIAFAAFQDPAVAGIYSTAMGNTNAGAPDAAIPGFVGPDGNGVTGGNNYVNPIFQGWATGSASYDPFGLAAIQNYQGGAYAHPEKALGPVTGNSADIVSLGDMTAAQIAAWQSDPVANHGPGSITLTFGRSITNGGGADFAVFENSFGTESSLMAELAYVEVSSNGTDFARFPGVSLTTAQVGAYGNINPTNAYNLVGKHVNAFGASWGTPFNLDDLSADLKVAAGLVNLFEISYVRLVDIPGDGTFKDSLGNPIYDAWATTGSGGLDLEAVGVIHQVPEPGSLAMLSMLALGAIFWKSRRVSR